MLKASLLDMELEILRNSNGIERILNGIFLLRIPCVDVVISFGNMRVLILDDCSHLHVGNREFQTLGFLVHRLLEDVFRRHRSLYNLAINKIVCRCREVLDTVILGNRTLWVGIIQNCHVCGILSVVLQHSDSGFDFCLNVEMPFGIIVLGRTDAIDVLGGSRAVDGTDGWLEVCHIDLGKLLLRTGTKAAHKQKCHK